MIAEFIGQGIPINRTIIPSDNKVDFLRHEILLAEINTWAIGMVGPSNFGLKYSQGRARPEEIVWFLKHALATRPDEVDNWGIPLGIIEAIAEMDISHPYEFTAYEEGAPNHPSWPAMHSAGSVASFWLAVVLEVNQDQRCEAMVRQHCATSLFGYTTAKSVL